MYNPFSLEGKTILITGASSGIGKSTAIECSKLGARVIITARNESRLTETLMLLNGIGHDKVVCDFNDEADLANLAENLPEINGLVNSAGIVKTLPFQFINKEVLTNVFETNFFAPVILTQKLVKSKKLIKGSSVVFISSIDGPVIAHPGNSIYSATKGAITSIVKNMALDLASKNIRVNCVLPGMTETPLINIDTISTEQLDEDRKKYPLRRYGRPEEIGFAAIYLLSDASNWVTGLNLIVDGGFTLQ